MKIMKKVLSAALSLVLCGSLMAPAFAATFTDLQNAIDGVGGVELENGHTGYAPSSPEEGETKYGIEAWTKDGIRNVQLNEDVQYNKDVDFSEDFSTSHDSIWIHTETKVDLDLNENTINGEGSGESVIVLDGGSVSTAPPELTISNGTISGGDEWGIKVGRNAKLELNDTEVKDNEAGGITAEAGAEVKLNQAEFSENGEGGDIFLNYGETGNYDEESNEVSAGASVNEPGAGFEDSGFAFSWTYNGNETDKGITATEETSPLSLTWNKKPVNPSTPDEPEQPVEPSTPDEPEQPVEPTTPGEPEQPVEPSTPDEPEQPINPTAPDEPEQPIEPAAPDGNEPGGTVEVDDPDVPLAEGPATCGEFIEKLWEHEGEPAPEEESREYAPAIAWAVSADIVSPETFDPEKALTVALAREFLTNFAAYADMAMPELTTLTGRDDDIVMDADGVLAEFFGE